MANEFKIRNGLIVNEGGAQISGSLLVSGSSHVITGSVIATNFTGSLFGTASWASNIVSASYASSSTSASYAFTASFATTASFANNANLLDGLDSTIFATTGSNTFRGTQTITGSTNISGTIIVVGSLTATSFTGSLSGSVVGTASWASNVISASYSSASTSASYAFTSSFATTASFVRNALSASYASASTSASYANNAGSATTASYVLNAVSASFAATASYVMPVGANSQVIYNSSGAYAGSSNLTFNGTDLDVAGIAYFRNVFANEGSLPDVNQYHGMFAHVHSTGFAYYAHVGAGGWTKLAFYDPTAGDVLDFVASATMNAGTFTISGAGNYLQVGNIRLLDNTISSQNSNGNIILDPAGSGTVDVSSAKITSLATPTATTDAATKGYVDAAVGTASLISASTTSTNANFYLLFGPTSGSAGMRLFADGDLAYNPSTNTLTVANIAATGSNIVGVLSASYASSSTSASYAATASFATLVISASYASSSTSASFASTSLSSSYAITASHALTSSYAINVVISGSINNPDYVQFNTSASVIDAVGRLYYDSGEGTVRMGLAGGNVVANIGADLFQYVYNSTGAPLIKGQIVYVSGSQGNRIAVKLASATAEQNSAQTLGFVAESIGIGAQGWIQTEGTLKKLDTSGLIGGQLIYLSSSAGQYTQTRPTAPLHEVRLGYAERIDNTVGSIYIKIDNGYEIDELHNVVDTTTTSSYGDLFTKSGSLWVSSKQLTGSYGLTGSLQATSFTGSLLGSSSYASSSTSASHANFAISSSFAVSASSFIETDPIFIAKSASLATTGSNSFTGDQFITGVLYISQSTGTASLFTSGTLVVNVTQPALALDTKGRILYSNFFPNTASLPSASEYHGMFVHVHSEGSAYYSHGSAGWVRLYDTRNYQLASTGSNTFVGNQTISGALYVQSSSVFTGDVTASAFYGSGSGIIGVISSSYALTASYASNAVSDFPFTGSAIITGSLIVTGSVSTNGILRLDPTSTNGTGITTSSLLFVSKSEDGVSFDLYYRNSGILWNQEWIEQYVDTGLIYGGIVSFSGSTIYVTPGAGLLVDHSTTTSSKGNTLPTYVSFGPITASNTYQTSSQVTYLYIDENGALQQQTSTFTTDQYHEKFPLGVLFSLTTSSISSFGDERVTSYGQSQQAGEFIRAFGPLKISGYDLTAQTSSLRFSIAEGKTFRYGGFYTQDPETPSSYTSTPIATASLARIYRDPSAVGGFRALTNAGAFYTTVDPTQWDDGSGTLQIVSASKYTIQRAFQGVVNNVTYLYYGQSTYDTLADAIASITTDPFEESPTSIAALPFIGYLITKGDTTDLSNTSENRLINAGLFRNTAGASGGGGAAAQNLADLGDVNITSPVTGQALIYSAGSWINGNPTSASYASTASYVQNAVSASLATTASYVLNAVSSSFASTASYVQNAVSASFATTASYVQNAVSASFATTASYIQNINKEVQFTVPFIAVQGQSILITNMPAAVDEIGTELRTIMDLTQVTSCSLVARVEQATSGIIGDLKVQYSTNESAWSDLTSNMIDLGVQGTQQTTKEAIPAGAKNTTTYLRLVTVGGDGTAASNTRFGNVLLRLYSNL